MSASAPERPSLAGLTEPEQLSFVLEVLELFAPENCSDLWWRTDGDYAPVTFLVNCSDSFWWATADAEAITVENLPLLRQAFADARAASEYGDCDAALLFCARVRGMRPQGAMYKHIEPELWPLFDAVGPPRETSLANPHASPTQPDPIQPDLAQGENPQ